MVITYIKTNEGQKINFNSCILLNLLYKSFFTNLNRSCFEEESELWS